MTTDYRLLLNDYRLLFKAFSFVLILLLCLFTYQAIKNSVAAVQLDNAYYYLQQVAKKYAVDENEVETIKKLLIKAQKSLATVGYLTPDDPAYRNLLSNLKIWQVIIRQTPGGSAEQMMQQAKKNYQLALQEQPNNPYLWSGLAKTYYSGADKAYVINAISQANYYGPSDKIIQKQSYGDGFSGKNLNKN